MIFVGDSLSDPRAHFVTNVIDSIGSEHDLIIGLEEAGDWNDIAQLIRAHCAQNRERYVIYNAYTDESFPMHFKKEFPELKLITFFSDDEWRHENYDRYLALFSDVFTIAVKDNVERYHSYGLNHVHYMQWACNPDQFYPIDGLEKQYDVTFIGAAYGKRVEYIRHLLSNGINVKVFGPQWGQYQDIRSHWGGFLSNQDMLRVISQSRINLNFLWTSREPERTTIKGRTLELAACRCLQLSNYTYEFDNYGFDPGENIAVFEDKNDLVAKVRFYLEHAEERQRIADAAYDFILRKHTWTSEFGKLFSRIESNDFPVSKMPRYRVLVIVPEHVKHGVDAQDDRLDVTIVTDSRAATNFSQYHGVIQLEHDSTMNNDSLYMMVFGLVADQAELALANFYVSGGKFWVRFHRRMLEKSSYLIRVLPKECMMFAGRAWSKQISKIAAGKKAIVEYPSFSLVLSYSYSRLLRLNFCDHGDTRASIQHCLKENKYILAASIVVDRLWQRVIFRH